MNPAELFRLERDPLLLEQGETLFRQGDRGDCMYVLLDGSVDILVGSTVVESARPGALLGEMAMVDSSPRSATVIATSDCKLARIDQFRFHFLVQQTPNFATYVMKVMADRLRRMNVLANAAVDAQLGLTTPSIAEFP